jgi:hypothetical protein
MFIEISPHEGVWMTRELSEHIPSDFLEDWESYRLNLNFVRQVNFEKPKEVKRNGEQILNRITFQNSINYFEYGTEWLLSSEA